MEKINATDFFKAIEEETKIKDINKFFENCSDTRFIIPVLQKANEYFLKNCEIHIDNLIIYPIETEIYFVNDWFHDGMCHMNELQKNKFGKLYFHRGYNNKIKCASTKNGGRGGVDVCLSDSDDYYLSILIRSAFINGTEKENLESGPRRICNVIRDFLYQQDKSKQNISCFFEKLEKLEEIIQNRNRKENININNIFYQKRIEEKDYSKTDSKNKKLNCLNLGEEDGKDDKGKDNYKYLNYIIDRKQTFYNVPDNINKIKKDFEKQRKTIK